MAPGDSHVVQEDVALRVTAGRGQLTVQQEAAARVGAAAHHQQRRAERQRVDGRLRLGGERRQRRSVRSPRPRTPRVRRWRSSTWSPRAARGAPARSGAPQLEQKRLASALRWPHLVQTGMDASSCRDCPAGAWVAYDRRSTLHPLREVDGSPKPMRARRNRVNRQRAAGRPECLRPDSRARPGTAGARCPAPRPAHYAGRGDVRCCWHCPRGHSCRTTSQTTSRAIPLDRNRPARGAGRTLNEHLPTRTSLTTSVSTRQFPPRTTLTARRPPATSCPRPRTSLAPASLGGRPSVVRLLRRSQGVHDDLLGPRRPSAVACSFSRVCTTPPGILSAGSRSSGLPITLKRYGALILCPSTEIPPPASEKYVSTTTRTLLIWIASAPAARSSWIVSSSMSASTVPCGSSTSSAMPGPCAATVPARMPSCRSFSRGLLAGLRRPGRSCSPARVR